MALAGFERWIRRDSGGHLPAAPKRFEDLVIPEKQRADVLI